MLTPIPRTRSVPWPVSCSRSASRSPTRGISWSGCSPTSWSRSVVASMVPPSVHTASWVRLRPTAAARTTPACSARRSVPAGRPPVAVSASSTSRPARASALTRAVTAVRDSPVTRPSALRVVARPLRISAKQSPGVGAAARGALMSLMYRTMPCMNADVSLAWCSPSRAGRPSSSSQLPVAAPVFSRGRSCPHPPRLPTGPAARSPRSRPVTSWSSAAPVTSPPASCCPRCTSATGTVSCPRTPGSWPPRARGWTTPASVTRCAASFPASCPTTSSTRRCSRASCAGSST